MTSTALDSSECERNLQDDAALARVQAEDCGVLIDLVDQEGGGHGVALKGGVHLPQRTRLSGTVEAVEALGLGSMYAPTMPCRRSSTARHPLNRVAVGQPDKRDALVDCAVTVMSLESNRSP